MSKDKDIKKGIVCIGHLEPCKNKHCQNPWHGKHPEDVELEEGEDLIELFADGDIK